MNRLSDQRVDITPMNRYRLGRRDGWHDCEDAYRYDFWFALCMGWVLVETVRQVVCFVF